MILNQCIKLFSRVSREVFGLFCEFDCSMINLWNVRLIMVWFGVPLKPFTNRQT